MKSIEVVAAIIVYQDKILCVQRGPSKYDYISLKNEFPGGKVESGETNEAALTREIKEELHMNVSVDSHYLTVNHTYPDFKITMHSFICSSATDELNLTEHVDFKWLRKDELGLLDWAAADIPIVEKLMEQ